LLRALNSRLDSTNVRSYGQRQPDLRLRLEKVDQRMGFWTNKNHRTGFDDAEDLAYPPSGGPVKMCLLGIGVALIPFIYGAHCLLSGRALLFGQNGNMRVTGAAATALAIAYMAVGVFIHAHWFWGLLPKLEAVSYLLKYAAVLVFIGSFGYAMYKIIV
jgi:hypothetical protein